MWRVPYQNTGAQFQEEKHEIMPRIEAVLASGRYVDGPEIEELESKIASYVGARHCVALDSGTDALIFGMQGAGIGPGDEVITPPNSFAASTSSIVLIGATPVFADIRPDGLIDPEAVEAAITPRTAAIMPVHLWGGICDMDALWEIAKRHGLAIIEDSAQGMGVRHRDRLCGALGTVGCHSTHPFKMFNAVGDGGFITTDSDDIAARVRLLRNYGRADRDTVIEFGRMSRLDAIQAAVLSYRLDHLDETIGRVRGIAGLYRNLLDGVPIDLPVEKNYETRTYSYYVTQCNRRNELRAHLAVQGVQTMCFYDTPLHLQPALTKLGYKRGQFPVTERLAGTNLALPAHRTLSKDDIGYVASEIRALLGTARQ